MGWISRMWLRNYDFGNETFDCATWADSRDEQARARIVIGQSGLCKSAWGPWPSGPKRKN